MTNTEHCQLCAGCDRPFMPEGRADLCLRCRERASDHLRGASVVLWMIAATVALVATVIVSRGASVVTESLLDRVAWAESRNNPRATGRLGEVGAYQLRPIAIREVNRLTGSRYTIRDARTSTAREIARRYLIICERRTVNPTPARVYAKYKGGK